MLNLLKLLTDNGQMNSREIYDRLPKQKPDKGVNGVSGHLTDLRSKGLVRTVEPPDYIAGRAIMVWEITEKGARFVNDACLTDGDVVKESSDDEQLHEALATIVRIANKKPAPIDNADLKIKALQLIADSPLFNDDVKPAFVALIDDVKRYG
jgi:predicted ArsR family transcriptional regulator